MENFSYLGDAYWPNHGGEVVLGYYGREISVTIYPSGAAPGSDKCTMEDHLLDLLQKHREILERTDPSMANAGPELAEPYTKQGLLYEICVEIVKAGKTTFIEAHERQLTDRTLHSLLLSERLYFQFFDNHGTPAVAAIDADIAFTSADEASSLSSRLSLSSSSMSSSDSGSDEDSDSELEELEAGLPAYSTRDITVLEPLNGESPYTHLTCAVSRVLVDGKEMFCKLRLWPPGGFKRELKALRQVSEAVYLRVPKLCGLVRLAEDEDTIGLLREWIPSRFPNNRLNYWDIPNIDIETREKWASQICETVDQLHALGIVWGDGKLDNVVIDNDDNAWLIDFAGGYTSTWIDAEKAGTVEGDEQAIQNIIKFLDVELAR